MKAVILFTLLLLAPAVMAQPATPTYTPYGHPAEPDASTRINLLWTDINTTTGRETTAFTWNVYRCSGAACTPTSSVATGRTTQDFGDSGLTANTIYGYAVSRVSGSESGKSPTVYITTAATDDGIIRFPSTSISFILGPLKAASPHSFFNSTIDTAGTTWANQIPKVGPLALTGTVSITNGTTAVTGSGTAFQEQLEGTAVSGVSLPYNHLYINGVDAGAYTINNNTSITLTTTWTGGTQSSVTASSWDSNAAQNDQFLNGHYYDLGLVLYYSYYLTGNLVHHREARKVAESIFAGHPYKLGRNRAFDTAPPPRHLSMGCMFVRALEGRDDMWDTLVGVIEDDYQGWIINPRAGAEPAFLREQAYVMMYYNFLQRFLPDAYKVSDGSVATINSGSTATGGAAKRATYKTNLETDTNNFAGWQTNYGQYLSNSIDCCSLTAEDNYVNFHHNIITGLFTDTMGYINKNDNLSSTARNNARKQVIKSANDFYLNNYRTFKVPDVPSVNWRAMTYGGRGGSFTNPHAFPFGGSLQASLNSPLTNTIDIDRQNNTLNLNAFGWAYTLSGDAKYKTWGDEFADASYGTTDGRRAICDAASEKSYSECFRSSARYFSHRDESPSSLGTAPTVTLPADITLTGGVNQTTITMSTTGSNLTYYWTASRYAVTRDNWGYEPSLLNRETNTVTISGLEPGTWTIRGTATDSTNGLVGYDDINVVVGGGVFYPVVYSSEGSGGNPTESLPILKSSGTTSAQLAVKCAQEDGHSVTHGWLQESKPGNASNSTVGTPTAASSTITGLTDGDWLYLHQCADTTTGFIRKTRIAVTIQRSAGAIPNSSQNATPVLDLGPNQVLPAGSTFTSVNAKAIDPEAYNRFPAGTPPTGYRFNYAGQIVVTALTHNWTQVSGPNTATIANGTSLEPTFSGLIPGTYTMKLTSSDPHVSVEQTMAITVLSSAQTVTLMTANLQHGTGTDGSFGFSRQITALGDADIIAVQERTTSETGWNGPMSGAGLVQAVYLENNTTEGDGPAIWYKSSTVTVNATYTRALNTGTNPSCGSPNVGWDCTTDVRKSAVAAKVTAAGRQFYVVSVHGCWSRCNNSNVSILSVQRENQLNDLVSWMNSTLTGGLDIVVLGDFNHAPDTAKTTGGFIRDIVTSNGFSDLWVAGIAAGSASTPWGDRDLNGIVDMTPADIGTQTTGTRTHDTRRIDYIYLKGSSALSLSLISVPDSRAQCSVALTTAGVFKQCPDVQSPAQLWDVTDDQGVRMSDHNPMKVVLSVAQVTSGGSKQRGKINRRGGIVTTRP